MKKVLPAPHPTPASARVSVLPSASVNLAVAVYSLHGSPVCWIDEEAVLRRTELLDDRVAAQLGTVRTPEGQLLSALDLGAEVGGLGCGRVSQEQADGR
ncbi:MULTISPECIES: hypothetical protein [unclassified Kribbella]|uniref:hypothetical protein n=1 Tax=unclassified Kribbella TaxID=2644121 RepID=UPI0033F70CC1